MNINCLNPLFCLHILKFLMSSLHLLLYYSIVTFLCYLVWSDDKKAVAFMKATHEHNSFAIYMMSLIYHITSFSHVFVVLGFGLCFDAIVPVFGLLLCL